MKIKQSSANEALSHRADAIVRCLGALTKPQLQQVLAYLIGYHDNRELFLEIAERQIKRVIDQKGPE